MTGRPRPSWLVILLLVDIALIFAGYVLSPSLPAVVLAVAALLLGCGLMVGAVREVWRARP